MTHEYSVEVQNYISAAISIIMEKKQAAEEKSDPRSVRFCEGQLEELYAIREYLTERIDLETQKYY
jgi:hypothetical protein